MVIAALLASMSIVLGKYASLTFLTVRISFENLPVIAAGIMLGPLAGALVGALADLVGCLLVGYAINPIITLGAAAIGLCAGLCSMALGGVQRRPFLATAVSCIAAHALGSILIKSAGISIYYGSPFFAVLLERSATYAFIAAAEILLLGTLFSNSGIKTMIKRI